MSKKGRRSSILKTPKPRNPLSDLSCLNLENEFTETIKTRRVSFANANVVQKFATDEEKNTIWFDKYEESLNKTTSSQNSTLKQGNDNSLDNSNEGLNCTRLGNFDISPERNNVDENVSLGSGCMDLTIPTTMENPQQIETIETTSDINSEKCRTICFDPNTNDANMDESEMCIMIVQRNDRVCAVPRENCGNLENIPQYLLNTKQSYQSQMNESIGQMELTEIMDNTIEVEILEDLNPEANKENIQNSEQIEMGITEKLPQKSIYFYGQTEIDITNKVIDEVTDFRTFNKNKIPQYISNQYNTQEMEFTKELPSTSYKPRQTIYYQNQEMDITEKLPAHLIKQLRQYDNHVIDMSLTEKVETEHLPKVNKYRKTIHDHAEMDLTEQLYIPSRHTINDPEVELEYNTKRIPHPTACNQENLEEVVHIQIPTKTRQTIQNPENVSSNYMNAGKMKSRQTIHFNNYEDEMELTEKLPISHIPSRQVFVDKNDDMNLTGRIPFNVVQKQNTNAEKTKSRQTIHFNNYENEMELTEKLPMMSHVPSRQIFEDKMVEMDFTGSIPSNVIKKKYMETEKIKPRQTIHFNNHESEMDLTEKLPPTLCNSSRQMFENNNEEMNFTRGIPSNMIQKQSMNVEKTKPRQTIYFNNYESEMELTEKLPPTSCNFSRQIFESNNEEMNFTRGIPTNMIQKQNMNVEKTKPRQTIHFNNYENEMELTEKLPRMSHVPSRQIFEDKNVEMDFTGSIPSNVIKRKYVNIEQMKPRQTIHFNNREGEMELTEKLPTTLCNSSEKIFENNSEEMNFTRGIPSNMIQKQSMNVQKAKPRQTIHFNNYENEMELTEKLPPTSCNFSGQIFENNNEEMNFTRGIPANMIQKQSMNVEKTKPRQTIHFNNYENEMELTEKLPPTSCNFSGQIFENNNEEMNFTRGIPTNMIQKQNMNVGKTKPRQTMHFNNYENGIELTEKLPATFIQTVQFNQEMDFTEPLPLKINNPSRQTVHYNQENEIVIPEKLAIRSKKPVEEIVNNLIDTEMEYTEKLPSNIENKNNSKSTIDPEVLTQKTRQTVHYINDDTDINFTEKISPKIFMEDFNEDKENNPKIFNYKQNNQPFNTEITYENQFRELAMKYQLQSTKLPDEEILSFNKTGNVKRRSVNYDSSDNSKLDISELQSINGESTYKKQKINNESTDNLCMAIQSIQFNIDDRKYQHLSINDLQSTNLQQTQSSICITENLTRCDNTIGLINYKINVVPNSEYSKIINEDIDTEILRLDETKGLDNEGNRSTKMGEIEMERNRSMEMERNRSIEIEMERHKCMEIEKDENKSIEIEKRGFKSIDIEGEGNKSIEIERERNRSIEIEGNKGAEVENKIKNSMDLEKERRRSMETEKEINKNLKIKENTCMEMNNEKIISIITVNDESESLKFVNEESVSVLINEESRSVLVVNKENKNTEIEPENINMNIEQENRNMEIENETIKNTQEENKRNTLEIEKSSNENVLAVNEDKNENSQIEYQEEICMSLRGEIKQTNGNKKSLTKNISLEKNDNIVDDIENKNDSLGILSESLINENHDLTTNQNVKQVNKTYVIDKTDFKMNQVSKHSKESKNNKSCIVIESSLDSSCAESSTNEKNLSRTESKSEYSSDFNSSDCMIIENNSDIKKSIDYSYLKNMFYNNIETFKNELKTELGTQEFNEDEILFEIEKKYNEEYGKCKTSDRIKEQKKNRDELKNIFEVVKEENKIKSYVDKIKEMSFQLPSWKIVKLGSNMIDVTTLDERFLFEVKFDSVSGIVENISFYSLSQSNKIRPYEKYIYEVFYRKITISYISSSCGKNYTILSLLDFITLQVQEMEKIIKELNDLSIEYGINVDKNLNVNVTFRSFRLRWLFEVEFNLLDLENISPNNIQFKIGNAFKKKDMRLNDIKSFATEKPKGYKFLRAYIESVNTFIEMLEKKHKN